MMLLQEIEFISLAAVAASLTLSIVVLFKLSRISEMLVPKTAPSPLKEPKAEPKLAPIAPAPPPAAEEDDVLLSEFLAAVDSGTDLSTAARIFNMTEDEARVADLCYRELEADSENRLTIS
jgi:hypothetical protein